MKVIIEKNGQTVWQGTLPNKKQEKRYGNGKRRNYIMKEMEV